MAVPWAAFAQMPKAPFPNWDRDAADRLLTESPWAQAVDTPLKDRAYRSELSLTVRWGSALPVRQANAFLLGLETRAAKSVLAAAPKDYVIEVAGFPAGVLQGHGGPRALEKELLASASLAGKTRRWAAAAVAVPEFGSHMMAELRFPRDPAIVPGDEAMEFAASALGGRLRMRVRFPLKAMVYGGQLEL